MKVGIITHYYKSKNYGGNLQAFALCKVLKKLGYEAEQISYNRYADVSLKVRLANLYFSMLKKLDINVALKNRKREKAILSFNQNNIPHSHTVYNGSNIKKCINDYDAFITGSDQVWHPDAVSAVYLLNFVPSEKIKLSYAASIAKDTLTGEQRNIFKEALKDYNSISVREARAQELIADISPCPVELTLDPTLLLTREEWNELIDRSYEKTIKEDYLFCYFLGSSEKQRQLANEYAKIHNLKIVNLPHLLGKFRECDKNFGDYRLYDVSPSGLLSLIKDASCIFTDSFHATVFSLIFKKEHFVFERGSGATMNSRIYNLVSIFETQDHFCDSTERETVSYIDGCEKINYERSFDAFYTLRNKSINFLKDNLQN